MDTIKLIFILIICSLLVLEGCYYYSTFTGEDAVIIPPPEKTILVSTIDGQDIKIEPYHFIEVKEPSNFVYGVGERAENKSRDFKPFCGKFRPIARTVEMSTKLQRDWYTTKSGPLLVFTLEDSSIIRMVQSDCIIVDSTRGVGLWYVVNEREALHDTLFSGRIPFEKIKSIEVKKFSTIMSVALISGIVAVPVIIFLASFHYTINVLE